MPAIVASTAWFLSRTLSSVGLPDAIVVGEKSMLAPRPPVCATAGAGSARTASAPSAAASPASIARGPTVRARREWQSVIGREKGSASGRMPETE